MNMSRKLVVSILLGAAIGFAYHCLAPVPKVAAAVKLGSTPGRHLEQPWWTSVTTRTANTFVIPSDLLFTFGSSSVGSQGRQVMRGLKARLEGAISIAIVGCTDPVGGIDSPYNIALGLDRARASVAVLEQDGLQASLFRIASWADTHPVTNVAGLDTATVNALDRRIVVIVTK
jgi:outer membrane protein OmpA-like peptidoglycan-associated protein